MSARPGSCSISASTNSSNDSASLGVAARRWRSARAPTACRAPSRRPGRRRRRWPRRRRRGRRRPTTHRTCSASSSAGSRWKRRCWVRLRMVSLTFCGSVVASTNTTCGGGSSSVFSSAASAGLRQHVDLVEDVHLVPPGRAERRPLDEVAHRVDAVVAGRVELVDVVARAALDGEARLALAARLAVDRALAVEHLGEDARRASSCPCRGARRRGRPDPRGRRPRRRAAPARRGPGPSARRTGVAGSGDRATGWPPDGAYRGGVTRGPGAAGVPVQDFRRPTTVFRWCPPEPVFPSDTCSSPSPLAVAGRRCSPAAAAGERPGVDRRQRAGRRRRGEPAADRAGAARSTRRSGSPTRSPWRARATRSPVLGRPGAQRRQPHRCASPSPRRCRPARCTVAWDVSEPTGEPGDVGQLQLHGPQLVGHHARRDRAGDGARRSRGDDDDGDRQRRRGATDEVLDASEVSDGPTWLGRVLSTFGLAVLFGSLVLIVAAWPEGPEYILAVRFLRSVWLLTLVGTLLYVVALARGRARASRSATGSTRRAGSTSSTPAGPAGRRWPASCWSSPRVWVVLRPERVIDPTTQLPALAIPTLAVVTLGLERTGGDLADPRRRRRCRPRPGDGGVGRRRRAARPRRARRAG